MIDVETALLDVRIHELHSDAMAFRVASSLAFRNASLQADPILLEPIMKTEILMPEEFMGEVIGDLNAGRARSNRSPAKARSRCSLPAFLCPGCSAIPRPFAPCPRDGALSPCSSVTTTRRRIGTGPRSRSRLCALDRISGWPQNYYLPDSSSHDKCSKMAPEFDPLSRLN